jgi:AcrR family transcriptional regulator
MATRKIEEARVATRRKKPKMTRADKLAATRRKLMTAATEIVGAEGYGNATVAKITARARVAQGTFYNYFESQQDLFDQLLPELGTDILNHIRARVADCPDGLKREEIGFRAFFEFLAETPEFYRILNEAETISPKAFRDHLANMVQGYLRALRHSQQQGGLQGYSADELEVIVCILLGARNYLSYHYMVRSGHVGPAPDWMVRAYMKFVAGGLIYGGINGRTYRPRRMTPARIDDDARAAGGQLVSSTEEGAVMELHVRDRHRYPTGAVRSGVLLDFAATTAEIAARGEHPTTPALLNLSLSRLAPARASRLFASARCERRGVDAVHVGIAICEDRPNGAPVASGQATFAPARRNSKLIADS